MPTALICFNNVVSVKDLIHSLSSLNGWQLELHDLQKDDLRDLSEKNRDIDLHYLIYSANLNSKSIDDISTIRRNNPSTFLIYYYSILVNQQFLKLSDLGVDSCIIGVNRKKYLIENLPKLWLSHWKRIPQEIYQDPESKLPSRGKKILTFIENRPIRDLSAKNISAYLKISQSHFRSEFRKMFYINFRQFKQKLLRHYESQLLLSRSLKPADLTKILNYKYIGNFSRSFKARHGENWRKLYGSSSH